MQNQVMGTGLHLTDKDTGERLYVLRLVEKPPKQGIGFFFVRQSAVERGLRGADLIDISSDAWPTISEYMQSGRSINDSTFLTADIDED